MLKLKLPENPFKKIIEEQVDQRCESNNSNHLVRSLRYSNQRKLVPSFHDEDSVTKCEVRSTSASACIAISVALMFCRITRQTSMVLVPIPSTRLNYPLQVHGKTVNTPQLPVSKMTMKQHLMQIILRPRKSVFPILFKTEIVMKKLLEG